MAFTELQYQEMLSRTERNRGRVPLTASEPVERESKLHDDIEQFCRNKGWYCHHARMDKKTTSAIGEPDFIIGAYGGRTLWIECKGRGGKPTLQQLAAIAQLKHNGHIAAIVYSFEEFLAVLPENNL